MFLNKTLLIPNIRELILPDSRSDCFTPG